MRLRLLDLAPANQSNAIPALGVPANAITIDNKVLPDLDISYFLRPNISAELVLTYPQKQSVFLSGTKIGTFEHLPPSLLLQYHFSPGALVNPYIGAGINYTLIYGTSINVPGVGPLGLSHSSVGSALQFGADVKLIRSYYLNVDVKDIGLSSDVTSGGAKVSRVGINPWLFGIGLGHRF